MLTSVLCSVKSVTETGVMKLLLAFLFSATSSASINGSDVSFVATNCAFLFSFLLIKTILFCTVFAAGSNGLFSPSFVQTVSVILIGTVVFSVGFLYLKFF